MTGKGKGRRGWVLPAPPPKQRALWDLIDAYEKFFKHPVPLIDIELPETERYDEI